MNDPAMRETDFPAGGLMTTAGDIALFYQALLNDGKASDGTRIWQSEMLREARQIRSGNLIDTARGIVANRALGIVIAVETARPICAASDAPIRPRRSVIRASAGKSDGPIRRPESHSDT